MGASSGGPAGSLAGLRQCMADLGLKRGFAVTMGAERRDAGRGIEILPWREIASGDFEPRAKTARVPAG